MSKVAIAGNASGTGTFTIAAPNSNTDRTLTLPDEAGTVLTTAGVPTSALPSSSIIQTVYGQTYLDATTTGVETDTGVVATITPTSATSKIFVVSNLMGLRKQGGTGDSRLNIYLYRDATTLVTALANMWIYSGTTTFRHGGFSLNYIDAPNTTSSLTYKLRFSGSDGSNWSVQADSNSGYSSIILLEVKA